MRIVLDTNVLVSGLLNPYGPPGRIVLLAAAGDVQLCYDPRILGEYLDVLSRPKFAFHPEQVEALLDQICAEGESVVPRPLGHPLPDPDDDMFLEVAIGAAVDYLVTGNIRHYPARSRGGILVISPTQFVAMWRPEET